MEQKHIFLNELNDIIDDRPWNNREILTSIKIINITNKYITYEIFFDNSRKVGNC